MGVAHLHKLCIAHRDIRPENLVVDWDFLPENYRLRCCYAVEGEDGVVNGQCWTKKGWMAPEMEERSKYSTIKADRWSTGQVLLYLLNKSRKEDTVLRMTQAARKLSTYHPNQHLVDA
jgi:serine/threonine protein kinase